MKCEINSLWDRGRKRPNVYIYIKPENDVERALMHAMYSVKPSSVMLTDGYLMLNFYPEGSKGKS